MDKVEDAATATLPAIITIVIAAVAAVLC